MSSSEKVRLFNSDKEEYTTQNPLKVDGDSVYAIDLDITNSSIGTFDGVDDDLKTLFNDYQTEISDADATNPKSYTLRFDRPLKSNQIGIGSRTGNFSNVKISLKDLSGTVRTVVDDSNNNTKYTSMVYAFTTNVFVEVFVEFYTADTVTVSGMYIPKTLSRAISSIDGYISETNSTYTALPGDTGGSDHIFTGTLVDTLNYGMVVISLKTDQESALDGLSVEFSPDRSNWDHIDEFTIPASTGKTFSFQTASRFMRVVYTNGVVAQTYFRLQTALKPVYVKPSSHRMADAISNQDDGELVKAAITGQSSRTELFENVATVEKTLSVNQALVHKTGISNLFHIVAGAATTLAAGITKGDTSITVTDGTGFTLGDDIQIPTGLPTGEFFFRLTDVTGSPVLVLDRPVPLDIANGTDVEEVEFNMTTTAGTLGSPVSYGIHPPAGSIWQITRILISITDGTTMDDGKFGGITALTNGVLLRKRSTVSGVTANQTNWKTNGDMALDMYDVEYTAKAPAGANGLRGRWTFTKGEFIVELDGDSGDILEFLIQDDITTNTSFEVKAQGRLLGG